MSESQEAAEQESASEPDDAGNDLAPALQQTSFPVLATVIAAVLGAVLAIAVQFALDVSGVSGQPAGGNASELVSRVQGIESEVRLLQAETIQPGDLAALQSAATDTRARLAVLETQGGGNEGVTSAQVAEFFTSVGELDRQFTDLETRTRTLEVITPNDLGARLDALVANTDFAELAARVDQLEANELANDMRRAALALGLAQLSRAAQGSDVFLTELGAITALRPDDVIVTQLRSAAEMGVPTQAMLTAEFVLVSRHVVRAGRSVGGDGAWQRVWTWVTQFFTIRRTGALEGDSIDAILARAELRLSEGNLGAAVQDMATLPELARAPAASWIASAEARVHLNQLITELSTEIITELEQ